MQVLTSLKDVSLGVLSPRAMVLLARYAQRLKKYSGIVLKLNAKTILNDVHSANSLIDKPDLQQLYEEILLEVNIQLANEEGRLVVNEFTEYVPLGAQAGVPKSGD